MKVFAVKNATGLFGTDWLELFDFWDLPINLYCKYVNGCSSENNVSEELK